MVKSQTRRALSVSNQSDTHQWLSDVKPALGGHDEGPNPHELLESALASCTSITVQMYAQRKSMKLENVVSEVEVLREGETSLIRRSVHFEGDLKPDERARLLEIANKCPIHKLLSHRIEIETLIV